MTIVTERFIRKPLYVDAVQITHDNFAEVVAWCQGEVRTNNGDEPVSDDSINPSATHIRVRVHNPKNVRPSAARSTLWRPPSDRSSGRFPATSWWAPHQQMGCGGSV
jgi:hypothetical protein